MTLQEKYLKSLERTIDLQEGLIAEQEAEIQRLERELQTEKLKPYTWPNTQPHKPWPDYPWTVTYGSDKVESYTTNFNPFMQISEPDEKKTQTQEGTGS